MLMPAPEGLWARSKREVEDEGVVHVIEESQILRKVLAFNQHGYALVLTPGGELVTPWSLKEEKFIEVYSNESTKTACPVCDRASILAKELDRFIHLDGSENRSCWVMMLRGSLVS